MADSVAGPANEAGSDSLRSIPQRPAWDRRKKFILAALCVAQFMVVLDIAVVNVALPSIKTDLGFSEQSLQWVITAYSILFGGFLLLGGRLSDYLGRRRLFMSGLVLFSVASLLSGFAWSETALIAFRAVQGLGGALLSPAALAILVTTYREGPERNFALGVWGGVAGSGAAAGTLIGGLLTSGLGWEWIFYVNVPIGAALIAMTPILLQRDGKATLRGDFDVSGAVTVTAALMVLVYALTRATQIGWGASQTIALLTGSVVLLGAFGVIEWRTRNPILPLRVLRLPTPRGANMIGFLVGTALFSQFFLLSLYMQQVLGYSALRTGVAYVSATAMTVIFAVVAQALVNRVGTRAILALGLLLVTVAAVLYTRLPVNGSYWSDLLPGFLLTGIGLGLTFVPLSIAALTGVRPAESGAASGMINTSQQIGGAVGLAAITTIVTTATSGFAQASGATRVTPVALTHGFRVGFVVLAGITGVAILSTLLLRRSEAPALEEDFGRAAAESAPAGTAMAGAPMVEAGCPVRVLSLVSGDGVDGRDADLLRAARSLAPVGMQIDEFDVRSLPGMDEPEAQSSAGAGTSSRLPDEVQRLREALASSEAVLVIAPPNGDGRAVRQAVDWARHQHLAPVLDGKPVAVVQSGDRGSAARALSDLHEALQDGGAHVVAAAEEAAGRVDQRMADALTALTRRVCPA